MEEVEKMMLGKDDSDLDSLEDLLDDEGADEFLEEYRRKRMEELQAQKQAPRFGCELLISRKCQTDRSTRVDPGGQSSRGGRLRRHSPGGLFALLRSYEPSTS